MTKTYLMLAEAVNIDGVSFPAGPRLSTDVHWTRMLRARGAEVITEKQYTDITAEAAAKAGEEVTADTALRNGEAESASTDDADDARRDQGSVADSLRSARSGRNHRRNARGR